MQDRIRALEDFSQISTVLAMQQEQSLQRMSERQARMEENQRRMEGDNQYMEESLGRIRELVEQLVQAVAVMQADIVRIDETHSQ